MINRLGHNEGSHFASRISSVPFTLIIAYLWASSVIESHCKTCSVRALSVFLLPLMAKHFCYGFMTLPLAARPSRNFHLLLYRFCGKCSIAGAWEVTDEENIIKMATGLRPQLGATIPQNICGNRYINTGKMLCGFIINARLQSWVTSVKICFNGISQ